MMTDNRGNPGTRNSDLGSNQDPNSENFNWVGILEGSSHVREPPNVRHRVGSSYDAWLWGSHPYGFSYSDPGLSGNLPPRPTTGEKNDYSREAETVKPQLVTQKPDSRAMQIYRDPARKPPAWKLNYKIGSGACGTVFLEKVQMGSMKSPELWAVKKISRSLPNFPAKRYQAEIKNLEALSDHGWFVKFNGSYQDPDYVYIAMEYIPIGDMSETFVGGYQWNEGDTRVVINQLLHGLVIMHKEGITHRDLKPENVFLHLPENRTHILHVKIGDFGTSKRIPPSNTSTYLKTTTGTQGYMAPEVHDTSKPKTNRVDIWSLGCILYRMVAGCPLFKDPFEVWKYTTTTAYSRLPVENIGLSAHCLSFLHDLLQPSPEDRPSAGACQKMAWMVSETGGSEYIIGKDLYTRLSRIKLAAPDIDSFSDMVVEPGADSIPAQGGQTGGRGGELDGRHTVKTQAVEPSGTGAQILTPLIERPSKRKIPVWSTPADDERETKKRRIPAARTRSKSDKSVRYDE